MVFILVVLGAAASLRSDDCVPSQLRAGALMFEERTVRWWWCGLWLAVLVPDIFVHQRDFISVTR